MNKKIVHLSDTSHPFTSYVDESDDSDNTTRTLTGPEFAAIRAFQSNWGYVGNHDISDDLVDMLADETTPTNTLINRVMRKWDLSGPGYTGIRTDLENLFILRTTVHFLPNEVKALESLEGEKSDKWVTPGPSAQEQAEQAERVRKADKWVETGEWEKSGNVTEKSLTLSEYNKAGKSPKTLRKELFQEEADKRVLRYFLGQTGWAWYVHFIVDMPEEYTGSLPNTIYPSKDGMSFMHMTSLYMSKEKAWKWINEDISFNTQFDDEVLTHVVELDKM